MDCVAVSSGIRYEMMPWRGRDDGLDGKQGDGIDDDIRGHHGRYAMISKTAWHERVSSQAGGASRYEKRRRRPVLRCWEQGDGSLSVLRCERRDGERDEAIRVACGRFSVCAVFVSSSFVSSDEAYAMERRGLEQLGGTHGE